MIDENKFTISISEEEREFILRLLTRSKIFLDMKLLAKMETEDYDKLHILMKKFKPT